MLVEVVVGVVGAAAVAADFVCGDTVAVWFWEGWVSACVAVGVLLLVLAVVPSVRLDAV